MCSIDFALIFILLFFIQFQHFHALSAGEKGQFDKGKISKQPPKTVYIHIGPHKTGTTHFQSFFYQHPKSMEHACWPWIQTKETYKQFHYFLKSIQFNTSEANRWKGAFEACFEQSQNIFLSTETFSFMNASTISNFQRFLSEAFHGREYKVKVIMTYREWLRVSLSFSESLLMHADMYENLSNFFDFLMFTKYDMTEKYSHLVELWGSIFGRENLIILDYYGMESARVDIVEAVCRIVQGDCSNLGSPQSSNDNVHLDLLYVQFIFIFDNFLHAHHMKQCELFSRAYKSNYISYLKAKKISFPGVMSSNLTELTPKRLQLNDQMYEEFGDLMLYANKTANEEQIRVFSFEALNENRIFDELDEFMEEEKNRLLRERKLCHLRSGEKIIPTA